MPTPSGHLILRTLTVCVAVLVGGCSFRELVQPVDGTESAYREIAGQVQYDDEPAPGETETSAQYTPPPQTLNGQRRYVDMTLDQVIEIGLQNSKVLRDLGGTILRSPEQVRTIHGPAIQETDPRFGVEAALSEFDARLTSTGFFENNDRALNNVFFGGGTRLLTQDLNTYRTELSKRTAAGTQLFLRNNTVYDANNAPGNRFPSAWDTNIEAEVRQPLLQGAGVFFNRSAGAAAVPGQLNGVIIARVARDVRITDFQIALRDYLANLENAYWDLYFAYRDLDAKKTARDESRRTWSKVRARFGQAGFEADKEAQAREQYYRFQQDVQDALSGRIQDGTRTNNGSTPGTFRRTSGVLVAERRLRLLMGWPINGESLLRPSTDPVRRPVAYDWDAILAEALARRPELRRQKQRVKRFQLELEASRSFLKPRFDAVGRYRFRGFGNDLINSHGDTARFGNAVQNLTDGDFQEWQLGFECAIPLGFRRAHAAVQHAELRLVRERAVLREQERQVAHDLSNAIGEVKRAYATVQTSYNRLRAARTRVDALKADETGNIATPDQLLEAHSRFGEAESSYFQALVEYMIAVRNVHFEKGSLFDYRNVRLENSQGAAISIEPALRDDFQFDGTAPAGRAPVPPAPAPGSDQMPNVDE